MKIALGIVLLVGILAVIFGSPFAGERPAKEFRYGSTEKILPMSFAHADHAQENCIDCHHNYVDDTGGGLCMTCHVTDQNIVPLMEKQYHDLCRGCHAEKAAEGIDGGPPRECMACHLGDDLP